MVRTVIRGPRTGTALMAVLTALLLGIVSTVAPPPVGADGTTTLTVDAGPYTFANGLTINGTLACSSPQAVDVTVQVTQAGNVATSVGAPSVLCGSSPTTWSALVQAAYPAPLDAGPATVEVTLTEPGSSLVVGTGTGPITTELPADPRYYLAMGDSLSISYLASPGQGYVDDIYRTLQTWYPGLVLVNLGCGGTTTTSFIQGLPPIGECYGAPANQLDAATTFLSAHPGEVVLTTIDVGGDDLGTCGIEPSCIETALATVGTNLSTKILPALAAAAPDVPLLGMNYYNPDAVLYLDGPENPTYLGSLQIVPALNAALADAYAKADVPMADVATAFSTEDLTPVFDPALGEQVPTVVAVACAWLSVDCTTTPVTPNEHANDDGYGVIADTFLALVPAPALPAPALPAPALPAPALPDPPEPAESTLVASPRFTG